MRGRGRVDCEASRVANVGDVIVKLQSINESASGFLAAGKFEADQPTKPAFQIPVCALPMYALLL